jgi:hypothetical protein
MDWKFVGDELFQRIGGLECVQETQAARVAGEWLVIPQMQIGFQQMTVRAASLSFTKM